MRGVLLLFLLGMASMAWAAPPGAVSPAGTATVVESAPAAALRNVGEAIQAPLSKSDRALLALALALSVWLVGRLASRARDRLEAAGLLPRLLAMLSKTAGLVAGFLLVWGAVAWLPKVSTEGRWAFLLGLAALAVGLGWGLLKDLVAGGILRLERRVRPGVRLEGERFSGTVTGIHWRVTVLRTPRGRLEVPNRELLGVPVRVSRASEHVLVLYLPNRDESSVELRRRVEDAVVASAWTPPKPDVMVHRDPKDGARWIVHCRLIDPRFAPRFDADLPERLEALLARGDPEDSVAPAPAASVSASEEAEVDHRGHDDEDPAEVRDPARGR